MTSVMVRVRSDNRVGKDGRPFLPEEPSTVFFLMLFLKVFHRNVCFICICIGTLQEDPSAHAVDNFSAHMPCRPRSGGPRVIIVYTGSGPGINGRPVTWHAGHNVYTSHPVTWHWLKAKHKNNGHLPTTYRTRHIPQFGHNVYTSHPVT